MNTHRDEGLFKNSRFVNALSSLRPKNIPGCLIL